MTIQLLEIPDDPSQWADWLEHHLVGLSLGDLVQELRLNPALKKSTQLPLSKILKKDELVAVIRKGLGSIPVERIQLLFGNPDALLKLQENILLNGTEYWESVPRPAEVQQSVAEVRARLDFLHTADAEGLNTQPVSLSVAADLNKRTLKPFGWLATAILTIVVGVFLWQYQAQKPSGRVLGIAGLTVNDVRSSDEYLNRIADAGELWFQEARSNRKELITLLRDVSSDCKILINAKHEVLTQAERATFVEKCERWKNSFDEILVALESDSKTMSEAKDQADEVMRKLVVKLRARPFA